MVVIDIFKKKRWGAGRLSASDPPVFYEVPKEVIHLQVPLQIPCYDLTLLVEGRLEYAIKRSLTHPQLRWFDGRCVQGAGAYSPCYFETRLLRNPAS